MNARNALSLKLVKIIVDLFVYNIFRNLIQLTSWAGFQDKSNIINRFAPTRLIPIFPDRVETKKSLQEYELFLDINQ